MNIIPIIADEKFSIPLGEALEEHRPVAASLCQDPDKILGTISDVFQVIAVNFLSSQGSELVLKANVVDVAERLTMIDVATRKTSRSRQSTISSPLARCSEVDSESITLGDTAQASGHVI